MILQAALSRFTFFFSLFAENCQRSFCHAVYFLLVRGMDPACRYTFVLYKVSPTFMNITTRRQLLLPLLPSPVLELRVYIVLLMYVLTISSSLSRAVFVLVGQLFG